MPPCPAFIFFFFFNDTATTEIYTLSLHDALPILPVRDPDRLARATRRRGRARRCGGTRAARARPRVGRRHRSEEHTSELQSPCNLVCRLLLEKKKNTPRTTRYGALRPTRRHPVSD